MVRFGSVRVGSGRIGSVRFGSVRFGSVRFGLTVPRFLLVHERTAAVNKQVKELQARYANNPEAANQAVQQLYQTENVNPLAGCLPALAQIPIFISLYRCGIQCSILRTRRCGLLVGARVGQRVFRTEWGRRKRSRAKLWSCASAGCEVI